MLKEYDLFERGKTSLISLELPNAIIRDLVILSNDNGTSIQTEIAIRLARSLERVYLRDTYDDQLAYTAFQYIARQEGG